MTKKFAAAVAVAGAMFVGMASAQELPMSVNDTGPVLTAEQARYQAEHDQSGVAGRPGYAMDADSAGTFYEVQTPSKGGPIDD
jgi:hypothetical protein